MGRFRIWTAEELKLFNTGMDDAKIAKITRRTVSAVASMRTKLSKSSDVWIVKETPLAFTLSQAQKEERLTNLMTMLKVRLG